MKYEHRSNPAFSVIVLTHNSGFLIGRCLKSLLDEGVDSIDEEVEILVVDSSTKDNTVEQVQGVGIPVIPCPGNVSVKRNAGLKKARGRVAVFLDSDCLPHKGWLVSLVRSLEPTNKDIVAVMGASTGEKENIWSELEDRNYREGFIDRIGDGKQLIALDTRNVALDREAVLNLGGFNEKQLSFEDVELGARIREAGYRILYAPDAVVTHKHRTTLRGKWKQAFWHARGAYLYHVKHKDSQDLQVRDFSRSLRIPAILGAWFGALLVLSILWMGVLFQGLPFWPALALSFPAGVAALANPIKCLRLFRKASCHMALYYLTTSSAQRAGVLVQFLWERLPIKERT